MPHLQRPDGCRLNYELHGPSLASPLVLLEGMGGDIPGWRRNIPHLSSSHLVIAYDFRGNGRSDKPDEPMSMRTFVQDTIALLDHLEIARVHAYGQSFGGMVGIELSLGHPDRVRSLVLGCTHGGRDRSAKARGRSKVPKDKPYLSLYSPAFARSHPEHVAEDVLVGSQQRQPFHAGRRQWEAMKDWSAWDRLEAIGCPVLVLHGTEDQLVPVENGRMLAKLIPGAELVLLEGAGHVYHSERPEEADEAVLRFLARVDASEPGRRGP